MSAFRHYSNHQSDAKNADNCGACALEHPMMIDGKMGINYAGRPLAYMQNGRRIPQKFMKYLVDEFKTDNLAYLENLKKHLKDHGYNIAIILREYAE